MSGVAEEAEVPGQNAALLYQGLAPEHKSTSATLGRHQAQSQVSSHTEAEPRLFGEPVFSNPW